MRSLLALTLFLAFTSGAVIQNNEVEIPEIKKLNFKLEDIVPKENVEGITKTLNSINDNNAQVNGIFNIEINAIVDGILENLKDIIIRGGMDPMELEDNDLKFPLGNIHLSFGFLQDLSTIKRYDDVIISYHTSTKKVTFLLPLSFQDLLLTYRYKTRVTLLSITGDMIGKLDDVKLYLEISYHNGYLSLGDLSMRDSGRFSVKFSGNGLVDWITNAMTTVVTTVFHPLVIRIVENFVKSAGEDLVQAVNDYIHGHFS